MKLHHMSLLVGAAIGAFALDSCHHARAESFFHAEVGLGYQDSRDSGEGVWVQHSALTPHQEQMRSPAFLVGATGELWSNGTYTLRYHADYVYFGQVSASCTCVPDSAYNPHTSTASERGYIPFAGFGHTQGIALTLDAGYTYHGYRFGLEAGPWFYAETWHESRLDPAYPNETNLSHKTILQVGYVVGARVERGPFGVSYRYYKPSAQKWNAYPGMTTGTHMLMATWGF
jgi:hypothetical protein